MEESSSYSYPFPPSSASAPSTMQDHQTPIQAHYSNIRRSRKGNPPSTGSAASASGSSSSSSQSAATDSASTSVANLTQYSNTDSDDPEKRTWIRQMKRRTKTNYEARVKEANRRRELEYIKEKERNERLRSEYDGTMDKIKRLKAYYLKCLSNGTIKCPSKNAKVKPKPASAPLVTVKSEIVLDENVLVKEEQPEPDPYPAHNNA